ncbi:probable receptor-like protein kinase At5g38990 [Camellia sinensis]|uniref:probable receptor-like protein kinase At5g38990 n=1 Tax=Camellia sinensis TaxID=4442 RepID=UPI0010359333|nr:probable receptor-like protein kinase At5g38990 [Camellia sinensis]
MPVEELVVRLWIEEDNRKKGGSTSSVKANVIEHGKSYGIRKKLSKLGPRGGVAKKSAYKPPEPSNRFFGKCYNCGSNGHRASDCHKQKKSYKTKPRAHMADLQELPNIKDMSGLSADDAISSVVIESCHCFSLAEIQSMTNNFNEELVIGMDGFGKVYKGFIDNGATTVAIKRLKADSNQGAEEFWNEVNMLSKLRHTHLVALIGQCSDCQEMILVYEYMAPGTLANHLYKQTTNILLDENYVAKISDFGFSKGSTSNSATRVSTKSKRLTNKSDVYAFGVVLLEVLCGRPPMDTRLEEEEISLILWAQRHIKKGKVDRIIDPSLIGQITPQSLEAFPKLSRFCILFLKLGLLLTDFPN